MVHLGLAVCGKVRCGRRASGEDSDDAVEVLSKNTDPPAA
jgi:hypothetical protein